MNIGENINRFWREAGLTQEALGDIVGVSMQAVSKWEKRRRAGASAAARHSRCAMRCCRAASGLCGGACRQAEDL